MISEPKTNPVKISVIIPFYNAALTLQRAMDSIANQTFRDFECILVDNNSTDGGAKTAKIFCLKDTRFRLIEEEKQGVAFASAKGSQSAKGKYIARMDADDYAMPGRLELQYNFLENNPDYGAVGGRVEHIQYTHDTEGFQRYVDWSNSVVSYRQILNSRFIEAPIINPTAMWRKEIEVKYGGYIQSDFPEDYEMWLRWLDAGVKIKKINDVVLKWYDSEGRLTRSHHNYSNQAFNQIKTKYLAKWLAENNPHFPEVVIWGASKLSRKQVEELQNYNVSIKAYIDIKTSRQLDAPVIHYKNIPAPTEVFILIYIGHIGIRNQIVEYLINKGFKKGVNFLQAH